MAEEQFEVFDEQGNSCGLVNRSEVHRQGLWHKSVQVFVFNNAGDLLIQKRSADKDIYPDCWDGSVGEHLLPGEAYVDGARRGLREELGIGGVELDLLGAGFRYSHRGAGFWDREIQSGFRCRYDGPLALDPVEVSATDWISLLDLKTVQKEQSSHFAPWFWAYVDRYGLLNSDS